MITILMIKKDAGSSTDKGKGKGSNEGDEVSLLLGLLRHYV